MTLWKQKESDFTMFKRLKMDENGKLWISLIPKETWKKHYISLCMTERNREESIDRMETEQPREITEEANLDKLRRIKRQGTGRAPA
jgi:hypothetical protein